jgi:DNA-binding response OmpR family regulator
VLIVDPRADVRGVIQAEYQSEHIWRTSCAADADEATSAALWDRPDAAIVNAVLPGKISGLQLARKLTVMDIPVLIMTDALEQRQRLLAAGCPFLSKRFRSSRVLAETRLLLSNAEQRKAALADSLDRMSSAEEELAPATEVRNQEEKC